MHGLPKLCLKGSFCSCIPRWIVLVVFRSRRASSKQSRICYFCDIHFIEFPAVQNYVGINMIETIWIVDPRILEEIAFCKKGFLHLLFWMVVGLNMGTIGGHWDGFLSITDDWEREVVLFPFDWQATNYCRSLLVITNILAWLSCVRKLIGGNVFKKQGHGYVVSSSLWTWIWMWNISLWCKVDWISWSGALRVLSGSFWDYIRFVVPESFAYWSSLKQDEKCWLEPSKVKWEQSHCHYYLV